MNIVHVPLSEYDLFPLKSRAAIQGAIQQRLEILLANGSDRCGAGMMDEFGLVHDRELLQMALGLTEGGRQRLDDDLQHLAPDLVASHFPREEDGRFPLNVVVLLASYAAYIPQTRDRQMWLIACAPKRRRDPQVITLSLASLIGVNHALRWDQARWLWDVRRAAASTRERWGVLGLDLAKLGLEKRAEHLAYFTQRCSLRGAALADQVALCLLLQDEGRVEEACALFGVELTSSLLNMLHDRSMDRGWAEPLFQALRYAALWRFAAALAGEKRQRLLWFPHQPYQSKASLMLVWANKRAGKVALDVEWTASNKQLAETAWKRPPDLDLIRFGRSLAGSDEYSDCGERNLSDHSDL